MHPSQTADKFVVRMPEGMRDRIKIRAASSRRTMNSLIIYAIDRALAADENESPATAATVPGSNTPTHPLERNSSDEHRIE